MWTKTHETFTKRTQSPAVRDVCALHFLDSEHAHAECEVEPGRGVGVGEEGEPWYRAKLVSLSCSFSYLRPGKVTFIPSGCIQPPVLPTFFFWGGGGGGGGGFWKQTRFLLTPLAPLNSNSPRGRFRFHLAGRRVPPSRCLLSVGENHFGGRFPRVRPEASVQDKIRSRVLSELSPRAWLVIQGLPLRPATPAHK